MTKHFIVVNIGCIECGVTSELVGVFKTRTAANNVAADQPTWRDGGQSETTVFEAMI